MSNLGTAALIALVREANLERLLADVKLPGTVIQTSLSEESERALRAALSLAGAA